MSRKPMKRAGIPVLKDYKVVWEIELSATSPLEAAMEARATQKDLGTAALLFTVVSCDTGHSVDVDLLYEEE
jgi:hypothetical protein